MITLKNITLRRGARVLLDDASCVINPGERVGLVGRNGAGKSTLFALLNGTLHEDRGDFVIPAQWRMAQVAQDMPETEDSATRFVIEGDSRLVEAEAEVAAAEASGDGERMAYAYTHLNDVGAHDAQARAQSLILGLGFKTSELDKPVNSFSGGWRMRLQLARALMCPSDLLLLDEPTNHLDLDALVWLEAWLKRYPGTLIVISHDREFLDAVTNVTIHIDHGKLVRYGGNYSAFEDLRAEQLAIQQASFAKQQEKIAHLQSFINRFKAKASKAKQAQSRVKALERMEKIAPVLADAEFSFAFEEPGALPNPMLVMEEAAFGYPPPTDAAPGAAPTLIVQHANRSVLAGQRIGILGANGQGKSTVVKSIAKDLQVQGGTVTEGRGLTIGYFAQQELDVLSADSSPLEHMIRLAKDALANGATGRDTRQQSLRTYLGTFNFTGDQVMQAVGTMSGGEKARLVLAMIVWQRPNLLLLDEPTNHLDLATREALSVALNEFEGTVMLVSHDRALLRAVCDSFWLVAKGTISDFDGDLDDYQQYLLDEARRQREAASANNGSKSSTKSSPMAAASPSRSKPVSREIKALQRDLDKLDQRIPTLQAEKSALENALAATTDPATLTEAGSKLHAIQDELDRLELRWLEVSEAIEACQS